MDIVDRASPVPLHAQFHQLILTMIESGELPIGAKLPTERQLAERFGVSVAPVRQAILDLAKEGFLYRIRGKGTFVRGHPLEEKITILSSFSKSMRAQKVHVDLRILRQEVIPTPERLREDIGDKQVVLIERLAIQSGAPVALLNAFLPVSRFPDLHAVPLQGQSLYRTLEERYGVTVIRADMIIEVARCDASEASLLQLRVGSPVLAAEGVGYDERGPVEAFRTLYRAERFRLRVESVRPRDRPRL